MNAPAPTSRAAEAIVMLPVDVLDDSPTNPRQVYKGIEDLAATIRSQGVIQPLIVRARDGGRYEIAAGHRRKRGAIAAGLKVVPCIVRELSDQDIWENQLIENCQREDIDALDEGESYVRLRDKAGLSIDQICARTGKSRSCVYGRIKLTELSAEARDALAEGTISDSVALLIARRPQKDQGEALRRVRVVRGEVPLSYRDAVSELDGNKHRLPVLNDAPFDPKSPDLPNGACVSCSMLQAGEGADVCTDGKCYRRKVEHHWATMRAEAEKGGRTILSAAESAKAVSTWGNAKQGWRPIDRPCHDIDSKRSLRELVGDRLVQWTVLAEVDGDTEGDPRGLVELLPEEALVQALKDAGHGAIARRYQAKKSEASRAMAGYEVRAQKGRAEAKRANEKRRQKVAKHRGAVLAFVAQVERGEVPRALWYEIAADLCGSYEGLKYVAKRRGLELDRGDLRTRLEKFTPLEAFAIGVEVMLADEWAGPKMLSRVVKKHGKAKPAKKGGAS